MEGVLPLEGRSVRVTHLERLLFPAVGFTKGDLIAYYLRVAPRILPHLVGHPVTLRRFPTGWSGPDFFQSRAPSTPAWVRTTELHFPRTGKRFDAVVVDGAASLLWAANLSTVEFHPYMGCVDALERPTAAVFDLDPGPPAGLRECALVAVALRADLDRLGLSSVVKTSGGLGLHVYVPLSGGDTFVETKAFAHALARVLRRAMPDLVVDVMARAERPGKVFVDWGQNDPGKSTVAPYSLRGFDVPTVSMPVAWTEVEAVAAGGDATALVFDVRRALDRIATGAGDAFAGTVATTQSLPSAVGRPA